MGDSLLQPLKRLGTWPQWIPVILSAVNLMTLASSHPMISSEIPDYLSIIQSKIYQTFFPSIWMERELMKGFNFRFSPSTFIFDFRNWSFGLFSFHHCFRQNAFVMCQYNLPSYLNTLLNVA